MFLLIAGTILLLLLYCFLHNSETASVLHHQSFPYSRALFDYDQQFIVYNVNELEVDSTTHSLRSFGEYSTNRNDCTLFFPLEYDYPTIRYPIPFSQYYQHEENRYRNYGIQQPILGRMKAGAITPSTDPSAIMLVIGSDTKQFYSMLKTIEQASRVFNLSALTIIDYGFSDTDIKRLQKSIQCFSVNRIPIYYRVFNFDSCPTWISMAECATRGGYSWKAISYLDATFQWNAVTLWLDTGVMINEQFLKDLNYVKEEGFYSPKSFDSVEKWLNPLSTQFLSRYFSVSQSALNDTNCLSAYVFVNPRNETIRQRVLYPYYQCAFTKRCIYPVGSSRANHRGEQSILSALVKSIHIPHTASKWSGGRPSFRQNRHSQYSDICFPVCLYCHVAWLKCDLLKGEW